jgi:hypothetical protein
MSRRIVCRKYKRAALTLCAILFGIPSCFLVNDAQGQEQQQSPPPPPPAQNEQPALPETRLPDLSLIKRRKIWTNDEVILLRTPADDYIAEKEAREAAEVEAAARSAAQPKATKEAPLEGNLPTTIEETQLLIKNKEQDIIDDQASVVGLNTELANVPDEQKKAKQREIEIVAAELDRARNDLKALQDHLVDLHKPPAGKAPAEPPPPPPPN